MTHASVGRNIMADVLQQSGAYTMARQRRSNKRTAPIFAKTLKSLIEKRLKKSQRWVARAAGVDPAAVHRLCTTGVGSEDVVCRVLKCLQLKRRHVLEILADRLAELSVGEARETWKNFRYAFPDAREYMAELCPFPLDRACACSYAGLSLREIAELAVKTTHIERIEEISELKPWQVADLYRALAERYGADKAGVVFARRVAKHTPLVLHLDVFRQYNAAEYVSLKDCRGNLLFGIPHVVLASYVFGPTGEVQDHSHAGGVEMLYSEAGAFELKYGDAVYPRRLENDGSVIALHGTVHHSIRLSAGDEGRLLVVRYDPRRRTLLPGPTLEERNRRRMARAAARQVRT